MTWSIAARSAPGLASDFCRVSIVLVDRVALVKSSKVSALGALPAVRPIAAWWPSETSRPLGPLPRPPTHEGFAAERCTAVAAVLLGIPTAVHLGAKLGCDARDAVSRADHPLLSAFRVWWPGGSRPGVVATPVPNLLSMLPRFTLSCPASIWEG